MLPFNLTLRKYTTILYMKEQRKIHYACILNHTIVLVKHLYLNSISFGVFRDQLFFFSISIRDRLFYFRAL